MPNLILILALLVTLAPPAAKKPSCYIMTNGRTSACICEKIALPVWVCAKVNR